MGADRTVNWERFLKVATGVAVFGILVYGWFFADHPTTSHFGPSTTVTYEVRGTASTADVTFIAQVGSTRDDVPLPVHESVQIPAGMFVEVDATLDHRKPAETGDVECIITGSDGREISHEHGSPTDASGAFDAAYCKGYAT